MTLLSPGELTEPDPEVGLKPDQVDGKENMSCMQLTMKEEVKGGQEAGQQGIQQQHKSGHDNTTYNLLSPTPPSETSRL